MSLKLDISQLAEIAIENDVKGADELVQGVIQQVDLLADKVAEHFKVTTSGASYESTALGGILAAFSPSSPDDSCPDPIKNADPDGDWD